MKLTKYSLGVGDRFGHQGVPQLRAVEKAASHGITITPVWNKSYREHEIIGTKPGQVRQEADQAVSELEWYGPYFVDADHITMDTIDEFVDCSDFFTIDVADYIGKPASDERIKDFIEGNRRFIGELAIPGIPEPFTITETQLLEIAHTFLSAIDQAGRIHTYIREKKGNDVAVEVSMDEVETPQTPTELFFILKGLSEKGVVLSTIAPKFTGRFNKGVDYVGDLNQFSKEFEEDILVIAHAVNTYGLPRDLKLSIHSGSDKFSIYGPVHRIIQKYGTGIHLKTSGTTWLEELTGLALAGGDGLDMVHSIYEEACKRFDELTRPYSAVIDVDPRKLPEPDLFKSWNGQKIASKLVHNPKDSDFDPQLRQFLHCSYKIAGERGAAYTRLLTKHRKVIGENVTKNLFERHIRPLFLSDISSVKPINIYENHKS